MDHRYVVVVPRNAPDTFTYLTESFKDVADVEVVVDRRRVVSSAPETERRVRTRSAREACGCLVVRVEAAPVEVVAAWR